MTGHFLSAGELLAGGPRPLPIQIERLLWHLGFSDVRNIDGAGDEGGDILGTLGRERFVFQCKWSTQLNVGRAAVDEVERAKARYEADRAIVVTNVVPGRAALQRQHALARVNVKIEFWTG